MLYVPINTGGYARFEIKWRSEKLFCMLPLWLRFVQLFRDSFKDFRGFVPEYFAFFIFFRQRSDKPLENRQTADFQVQTAIVNSDLKMSFGNFFRTVKITNYIRPVCRTGYNAICLFLFGLRVFHLEFSWSINNCQKSTLDL